jgi:hypothetical protein
MFHEYVSTHLKNDQHEPQPNLANEQIIIVVFLINCEKNFRIEGYPEYVIEIKLSRLPIPSIGALDVTGKGENPKHKESK